MEGLVPHYRLFGKPCSRPGNEYTIMTEIENRKMELRKGNTKLRR